MFKLKRVWFYCFTLLSTSFVFLTVQAYAQVDVDENLLSPAHVIEGKKSLADNIIFPRFEGDISILILCKLEISKNGDMGNHSCPEVSSIEHYMDFRTAVELARFGGLPRMAPAVLEGKKVAVIMQFSVLFEKKGESEKILFFPHQFVNYDNFGTDYIAAQRVTGLKGAPKLGRRCYFLDAITVRAVMAANGKPEQVDVKNADESKEECNKILIEYIRESTFIPATLNNQYVPSLYMEPFFIPR